MVAKPVNITLVGLAAGAVALAYLASRSGAAVTYAENLAAGSVDLAGGLLTGNNAITHGARTDAYQGAGILGTLGAGFDRLSGGTLSRFGQWSGGMLYDLTH